MSANPVLRVTSVTIGAPDPRALAAFYARLLGWTVAASDPPLPGEEPEAGWAQLRPPPGERGPRLNFEYEAHFTRPAWPSVAGEQHITGHLDIAVTDLDLGARWALEQGATLADYQPQDDVRVLLDPAGHPFCLYVG